jgi:hypothetical protein
MPFRKTTLPKAMSNEMPKVERFWNKLPDLCTSQDIVRASDYDALQAILTRYHDLVRFQRSELHKADLITDEEYAALLSDGNAVSRLESYDEIQTKLTLAQEAKRELVDELRTLAGAFAVTLMVLDERANGETDPDKRYEFAEKHSEIKAARKLLTKHGGKV